MLVREQGALSGQLLCVFLVLFCFGCSPGWAWEVPPGWHELLARASSGDMMAEYLVGRTYLLSGQENATLGFRWLKRSGEKGYLPAMLFLAQAYEQGLGTKVDFVSACQWYKKAARSGDKVSRDLLAPLHNKDPDRDFILFDLSLNKVNRFCLDYILQKNGGLFLKRDALCDLFASKALLSGTDQVQACFTSEHKLAHLEYRFPPRAGELSPVLGAVYEKLILKYGREEKLFGQDKLFKHVWIVRGVRIELWFEPDLRTAFLRYTIQQRQEELQEMLHRKKQEELQKQLKRIKNL